MSENLFSGGLNENEIALTSSPAHTSVKNDWEFAEVWVDPMLSPPYILLLLSNINGNYRIYDPAQGYKIVFSSNSYDEAQLWLLEDMNQSKVGC